MEIVGEYTTNVHRALGEIDRNYMQYYGLVIAGSHDWKTLEIDDILFSITQARLLNKPTLGICFGWQLMAIEYAQNVMGIKDATSEEFGNGFFVVKKLPQLNVGLRNGQSYWNNYAVDQNIIEAMNGDEELQELRFYRGTQYHPEYQSSKLQKHPLLVDFIKHAKMAM